MDNRRDLVSRPYTRACAKQNGNTSMTVKTFQSFVMAFWVSSSSIAGKISEKAWDNRKLLEAAR